MIGRPLWGNNEFPLYEGRKRKLQAKESRYFVVLSNEQYGICNSLRLIGVKSLFDLTGYNSKPSLDHPPAVAEKSASKIESHNREYITAKELKKFLKCTLQPMIEELLNNGGPNNTIQEKKLLTAQESADYLQVSLSTVYKYSHGRVIPFYKPNGRDIFFKRSDLDAYIERQRFASQDELSSRAADYLVNRR